MTIQYVAPTGDATGVLDYIQINTAIQELKAAYPTAPVLTIVLQGKYYLNQTLAVTSDPGVMFDGANASITQVTASIPSIQMSSTTSGGARGITFIASTEDDDAVEVSGCTNTVFETLDFSNYTKYGVVFTGTHTLSQFDGDSSDMEFSLSLVQALVGESRSDYCRTVYSYSAAGQGVGCDPYKLLTQYWWYAYDGSYDTSRIDPDVCSAGVLYSRSDPGPALMDIEEWDAILKPEQAIRNMRLAAETWRAGGNCEVGFYAHVPYNNYWAPVGLKYGIALADPVEIAKWSGRWRRDMRANQRNAQALGPYVDYYCPRGYVTYNTDAGIEDWKWYYAYSVTEALRVGQGKPVRPIVWWYAQGSSEELSEARWIAMLQFAAAFPGIDALMIYSSGDAPSGYTWTDAIEELINGTGDFA